MQHPLGPHAERLIQTALARRQQAAYAAQQADADYLAVVRALAEVAGVPEAELEIVHQLTAPDKPAAETPAQPETDTPVRPEMAEAAVQPAAETPVPETEAAHADH